MRTTWETDTPDHDWDDGSVEVDVTDSDALPGWRFRVRVESDGRTTRLEVEAPEGWTATNLRRDVSYGELQQEAQRSAALAVNAPLGGGLFASSALQEELEKRAKAIAQGPPTFGSDDPWYAKEVASPYVQLVVSGSRRPVADLAARMGVEGKKARELVRTCRNRGLLPAPGQGDRGRGARLTEKAKRLISEGDE